MAVSFNISAGTAYHDGPSHLLLGNPESQATDCASHHADFLPTLYQFLVRVMTPLVSAMVSFCEEFVEKRNAQGQMADSRLWN